MPFLKNIEKRPKSSKTLKSPYKCKKMSKKVFIKRQKKNIEKSVQNHLENIWKGFM